MRCLGEPRETFDRRCLFYVAWRAARGCRPIHSDPAQEATLGTTLKGKRGLRIWPNAERTSTASLAAVFQIRLVCDSGSRGRESSRGSCQVAERFMGSTSTRLTRRNVAVERESGANSSLTYFWSVTPTRILDGITGYSGSKRLDQFDFHDEAN